MHALTAHPRRLLAVLAAVTALAAPAARAGIATDDPSGFLRDRPVGAGGTHASSAGQLVEQLICAEDCIVSGRVVIAARDATRLGLGPVAGRWFEVGRFQDVALEARSWKSVTVRLGGRTERRLRRSRVRFYGVAVAISLQSRRHGRAGWAVTYGR
jgi:hypothetical protein